MSTSILRQALILGALSSIGPFAIDMYLPAMDAIRVSLDTTVQAMQGTVISYFLAFGLAQLIYGPWSDRAGRRVPLYAGLGVFLIGSLICTFAPSIEVLIAGRFVQGLGGAAVMVVPRAIIRDRYRGHEATRLMAANMLVISVVPLLAPLAGAMLIKFWDWREIFGFLGVLAIGALALTRFGLPESLPADVRRKVSLAEMMTGVKIIMTHRSFLGLTLIGGFGMASFFVFIASASFVYSSAYGLSPTQFSIAFAANAVGFFAASQFAANLGMRFGAVKVVLWAVAGFALATSTTFLLTLSGFDALPVVMIGLFCGNACLGLVMPTTMVLALDEQGERAGLASSLGGTMQMVAGGAMIGISSPFFDGTPVPMLGAIATCAIIAFILSRVVVARQAAALAS